MLVTHCYTCLSHSQEKERELEAKNIYANRMLKLSPRKDADIIQRKRGNLYKAINVEKLIATHLTLPPLVQERLLFCTAFSTALVTKKGTLFV